MTKYIKTGTTEFEQFDGSDKMIDKYELIDAGTMLGIHHSPELYLTGSGKVDVGDWIATGVGGEHWPVKDEIFQKEYERLPVILKYVANMMSIWKVHSSLQDVYSYAGQYHLFPNLDDAKADFWVVKHNDEFARAWLDGYEVAEVEE